MNVSDLLRRAARRPDKIALHYGHTSAEGARTFADIDRDADRIAGGLRALGVARGDRVALLVGNVPEFVHSYFGILRAGAVAVPLNGMLAPPEISRILADAEPEVVLAHPGLEKSVDARGRRVTTSAEVAAAGSPVDEPVSESDLAVLAYTSGTTGEPKGAMLTHGNLLVNLDQQMAIEDAHVTEDDVLLLALPLWHIFGLNVTLGLVVKNAATGVLLERFEPVAALRAVQELGVTVLFGAPTMYSAWVSTPGADQYDLSSVRLAVCGAAPLDPGVLDAFKKLFAVDVYEGYGLTETAPTITSNRMAVAPRPGSAGRPLPGVELRVIDEDGNDVEVGDPGEVVVRGANVFQGYWKRDELTSQAFIDGGWFRTGDIAVRDEEGYLYLVDRTRDLIIVSGFNVFPSEVEAALIENPAVEEAAVVGVPHEYTGEAVKAYVVRAQGATLTEQGLLDDVRARLARFKCPEEIEFVDELPHQLTGKVLRRALRT